jgi:hypothetical protein
MIDDLKKDSARWRQDQDRRSKQGRNTGTPSHQNPPGDKSNGFGSVSYAGYAESIKGRQEVEFPDSMDVDDHPYEAPSRHREIDPRDPRSSARHMPQPVSGYVQDPYPAYAVAPGQSGYRPEMDPRYAGNSTPPSGRVPVSGYSQPGYTSRSSAAPVPAPVQAYRDPRTGQIVSGYDAGYTDSSRRHR